MIYAAVKALGATNLEAYSAARSLREAIPLTSAEPLEAASAETIGSPVQIDLEYDEETITVVVRGQHLPQGLPTSGVRH